MAWHEVDQFGTLRIGEARVPGPPMGGFDDPECGSMDDEEGTQEGCLPHGWPVTSQVEHQEPPFEPSMEEEWECGEGGPGGRTARGHEEVGQEEEALQEQSGVKEDNGFLESKVFQGAKKGYAFKLGDQGVGYYKEGKTVEDENLLCNAPEGIKGQAHREPVRLRLAELIKDQKGDSWHHTAGLRVDGDEELHQKGQKGARLLTPSRGRLVHWRS